MVFFTCNACGESVKKVQVEKHVAVCRNCECLSCIDCGKDFWGDDYKNHVKCISEDEKYGGRGYEGKAHKGDLKQQAWVQKINELVKKPNVSPKVRDLLEQISTFDNIPRKRAKFQNWMKNSLKIYNEAILEQVWNIFSEASRNEPVGKGQEKKPAHPVAHPGAETFAKVLSPSAHGGAPEQLTEVKKNKRERKEERQKNRKKEKKELKLENQRENITSQKAKKCKKGQEKETGSTETPEANGTARRKGKKQRGPEQGPAGGDADGDRGGEPQATGRAGKRKRKHSEGEASSKKKMMKLPEHSEAGETEDHDPPVKGKFSWKGTIKAVLKQAPDKEIAVKKLRKKVLAQYHAVAGEQHRSEEELLVIFHKKISKNPTFKLLKDKVKLVK